LSPEAEFVQNELGIDPNQWDQQTLSQIAALYGFTGGYQPTSQGTMYMGSQQGYGGGQDYGAGSTYMGGNSEASQFVDAMGFDTTGMSQSDIEMLASDYGYQALPSGASGPADTGATQGNDWWNFDYGTTTPDTGGDWSMADYGNYYGDY
jgi:hypothetical protein